MPLLVIVPIGGPADRDGGAGDADHAARVDAEHVLGRDAIGDDRDGQRSAVEIGAVDVDDLALDADVEQHRRAVLEEAGDVAVDIAEQRRVVDRRDVEVDRVIEDRGVDAAIADAAIVGDLEVEAVERSAVQVGGRDIIEAAVHLARQHHRSGGQRGRRCADADAVGVEEQGAAGRRRGDRDRQEAVAVDIVEAEIDRREVVDLVLEDVEDIVVAGRRVVDRIDVDEEQLRGRIDIVACAAVVEDLELDRADAGAVEVGGRTEGDIAGRQLGDRVGDREGAAPDRDRERRRRRCRRRRRRAGRR